MNKYYLRTCYCLLIAITIVLILNYCFGGVVRIFNIIGILAFLSLILRICGGFKN